MDEIADAARVIAWANESPRRPANAAFTAGPERQAAYWIEWAEERCATACETVRAQYDTYSVHDDWPDPDVVIDQCIDAIRSQK